MIWTLQELVSGLPCRDHPLEQFAPNPSVSTAAEPVQDYIWPTLRLREDSAEVDNHLVLLVTAPGAMGKSAAARSVANATGGVYVDLAKMHVGSGALTGELYKALGADGFATFRQQLTAGEVTLVLDSTDEAQLRAGSDSFIEFVRDLVWNLADGAGRNQVLLFGRLDSIDLTTLALEEVGIVAPTLEIAPLEYASSCDFIDLYLDRRSDEVGLTRVHRIHAEPFGRLRDRVFADLIVALRGIELDDESIVDEWADTAEFLGYPPVLAALAERLHVPNPNEEVARLTSDAIGVQRRRRGELLRSIVENILERESTKVQDAVGERIGLRNDDPARRTLYTPDEQIARLLDAVGVAGVRMEQPASLDEIDRAQYDQLISGFVPDHPFLRNAKFASEVFSDYARAWAISSPLRGAWIASATQFNRTLPLVGPFFVHFLSAMSPGDQAEIPEWQVSDALKSNRMGSGRPYAVMIQQGAGSTLLVGEQTEDDPLDFTVTDLSGGVELRSPLAGVTLITDAGVVLVPASSGQFELGPDAIVVAEEIEIQASRLAVTGREPREVSLLSAESVSHPADLVISVHPRNSLVVHFPDAWQQWKPYATDPASATDGASVPRSVRSQIVIAVRRILSSFRPSSGESLTVSADKVDRLLVGRNQVYAATRDAMIRLGLVKPLGPVYELDLAGLNAMGVSWHDLSGDDPDRALRPLCSRIIAVGDF